MAMPRPRDDFGRGAPGLLAGSTYMVRRVFLYAEFVSALLCSVSVCGKLGGDGAGDLAALI